MICYLAAWCWIETMHCDYNPFKQEGNILIEL